MIIIIIVIIIIMIIIIIIINHDEARIGSLTSARGSPFGFVCRRLERTGGRSGAAARCPRRLRGCYAESSGSGAPRSAAVSARTRTRAERLKNLFTK